MKFNFKEDAKRIVIICIASVIIALNIKTFVRTGGIYPGGVTGLTLLIQRIVELFFGFELPYTVINIEFGASLHWFSIYWQKIYAVFLFVHYVDEYLNRYSTITSNCI